MLEELKEMVIGRVGVPLHPFGTLRLANLVWNAIDFDRSPYLASNLSDSLRQALPLIGRCVRYIIRTYPILDVIKMQRETGSMDIKKC